MLFVQDMFCQRSERMKLNAKVCFSLNVAELLLSVFLVQIPVILGPMFVEYVNRHRWHQSMITVINVLYNRH